jgi:hypothetical protein
MLALFAMAGAFAACSDTVPPPGATLSGFVYHDTNLNGIKDSCDSGESVNQIANVRLISLDGEDEVIDGFTREGFWTIRDVPPGNYELELAQPTFRDSYWLVTGPLAETGEPHHLLSLEGFETVEDLDFGIGTKRPITVALDRYALYTALIADVDSDGEADPGECVLDIPTPSGTNEPAATRLQNDLSEPPDTVSIQYQPSAGVYWSLGYADPGGPICETGLPAKRSSAGRLYFAALGVEPPKYTVALEVSAFVDGDLDGLRDADERGLYHFEVTVSPAPNACLLGPAYPIASAPVGGKWTFRDVPEGEWDLIINNSYQLEDGSFAVPTGGNFQRMEVGRGEARKVDLPFRLTPPSFIDAHVIEDLNANGRADSGEPGVDGLRIACFEANYDSPSCIVETAGGVARVGPFIYQTLRLAVLPTRESMWHSEPVEVSVGEGETKSIVLLVRRIGTTGIPNCTAVSC